MSTPQIPTTSFLCFQILLRCTARKIAKVLSSQVISNVPAAVLLSNFTQDAKGMLLGTNIGGLGTLVASLASLISFKIYAKTPKAEVLRYLGIFTAANVVMLIVLP